MNKRVITAVLALLAALVMIVGMVMAALPSSAEGTTSTKVRAATVTARSPASGGATTTVKQAANKTISTTTVPSSSQTATTGTMAAVDSADKERVYSIAEINGKGLITTEPSTLCFWEYPRLSAGQQRQGTIRIDNKTANTVDFRLSKILLPYGDEAALTYLTTLHITIADSRGTVYYDGLYSNIVGKDGLKLDFPAIEPGKSASLEITMRCAFTYTGDLEQTDGRVTWKFEASASTEGKKSLTATDRILGIGAFALAGIGIFLLAMRAIRRKKS